MSFSSPFPLVSVWANVCAHCLTYPTCLTSQTRPTRLTCQFIEGDLDIYYGRTNMFSWRSLEKILRHDGVDPRCC